MLIYVTLVQSVQLYGAVYCVECSVTSTAVCQVYRCSRSRRCEYAVSGDAYASLELGAQSSTRVCVGRRTDLGPASCRSASALCLSRLCSLIAHAAWHTFHAHWRLGRLSRRFSKRAYPTCTHMVPVARLCVCRPARGAHPWCLASLPCSLRIHSAGASLPLPAALLPPTATPQRTEVVTHRHAHSVVTLAHTVPPSTGVVEIRAHDGAVAPVRPLPPLPR